MESLPCYSPLYPFDLQEDLMGATNQRVCWIQITANCKWFPNSTIMSVAQWIHWFSHAPYLAREEWATTWNPLPGNLTWSWNLENNEKVLWHEHSALRLLTRNPRSDIESALEDCWVEFHHSIVKVGTFISISDVHTQHKNHKQLIALLIRALCL